MRPGRIVHAAMRTGMAMVLIQKALLRIRVRYSRLATTLIARTADRLQTDRLEEQALEIGLLGSERPHRPALDDPAK